MLRSQAQTNDQHIPSAFEAQASAIGQPQSLAWEAHAGSALAAADLMIAFVADRLERTVDRMLMAGHGSLGLMGRADHLKWLFAHVHGMSQLPVMAYIAPPGFPVSGVSDPALAAAFPIRRPEGMPEAAWYDLSDPTLPGAVDAVLVCDDLYQQTCIDAARKSLPPKLSIARLYDRLPIGNQPLPAPQQAAASPVVTRRASPSQPEPTGLSTTL